MRASCTSVAGAGYEPEGEFTANGGTAVTPTPELRQMLTAAALASDAQLVQGEAGSVGHQGRSDRRGAGGGGGQGRAGEGRRWRPRSPRVHEIPFTSESKRMTTLHAPDGAAEGTDGVCQGRARGDPAGVCLRAMSTDGAQPLDGAGRERILAQAQAMAGEALRVLAVAAKPGATPDTAESGMTFLGLVGMIDPPRPEAKAAIARVRRGGHPAGDDHRRPPGDGAGGGARAGDAAQRRPGRDRGRAGGDAATSSSKREVEDIEVYARVSPAHKLRVVTALAGARATSWP